MAYTKARISKTSISPLFNARRNFRKPKIIVMIKNDFICSIMNKFLCSFLLNNQRLKSLLIIISLVGNHKTLIQSFLFSHDYFSLQLLPRNVFKAPFTSPKNKTKIIKQNTVSRNHAKKNRLSFISITTNNY